MHTRTAVAPADWFPFRAARSCAGRPRARLCCSSSPGPPSRRRPRDSGPVQSGAAKPEGTSGRRAPDVIFVPTPDTVVAAMLDLAAVSAKDIVYHLGSGDGRIVIAAARDRGARAVGVDINPAMVEQATENARKAGVIERARFVEADLFETDLSKATVVTLYLLPSLNQRLMPKLVAELKPGSRIVSHAFDMGSWKPDETRQVDGRTNLLVEDFRALRARGRGWWDQIAGWTRRAAESGRAPSRARWCGRDAPAAHPSTSWASARRWPP